MRVRLIEKRWWRLISMVMEKRETEGVRCGKWRKRTLSSEWVSSSNLRLWLDERNVSRFEFQFISIGINEGNKVIFYIRDGFEYEFEMDTDILFSCLVPTFWNWVKPILIPKLIKSSLVRLDIRGYMFFYRAFYNEVLTFFSNKNFAIKKS